MNTTKIIKHPDDNTTFYALRLSPTHLSFHLSYDACNNWVKNVPQYAHSGQTELSATVRQVDPTTYIDVVLSNGSDIETVTLNCDTGVITSNNSFSTSGIASITEDLVVITR